MPAADAVTLGPSAASTCRQEQLRRHAVSARGRLRRGRADLRKGHGIEDRDTRYRPDEVTYVSIGEGGTSEGSSGNHSTRRVSASCRSSIWLKTTATRSRSRWTCRRRRRHLASRRRLPGLRVFRCDGTDFLASYRTMREAVASREGGQGPALVHAHRHAAVLALLLRRRAVVQDAG
jgi:hypothetical protein